MFAIIQTRTQVGIRALPVSVEVHLSNGLPQFAIVGLPETVVKESKERVRSALLNSNFEFPNGRITVNLAPADIPKEGGRFDLPIAIGILVASGQLETRILDQYEFAGELALNGSLRAIPASLPFAYEAHLSQKKIILPVANATEAGQIKHAMLYPAKHLLEVAAHLKTGEALTQHVRSDLQHATCSDAPDLADVIGQPQAKRALEIAAAGGHNLLLVGPPGTGKTMLAMRLPGIMPEMDEAEAIESATIRSIRNLGTKAADFYMRPFRQPHHTSSAISLVGGGSNPKPGEISLAHNGVLFLDELPEFDRKVLEVLREPLESGQIHIARASRQASFPAKFQLIAAMNPCPCGYAGSNKKTCSCRNEQIQRYQAKLSGPLLDRIDLHLQVHDLPHDALFRKYSEPMENTATVRQRVINARHIQLERQKTMNAALRAKALDSHCSLGHDERQLMMNAIEQLKLSPRASHRVLRVARTIADLEATQTIKVAHLAEALSYRGMV